MYDVEEIRKQFPILQREVYGKPLVYLDNGATTQKPLCVLNAMQEEYLNTISRSKQLNCTKERARPCAASSTPEAPVKLSLREERRKHSTSWQPRLSMR